MLRKSSLNHYILFVVTGITYDVGILIIMNEKGGLRSSTLCFCTISQSALTCLNLNQYYKQLLLTMVSMSIVDLEWRKRYTDI